MRGLGEDNVPKALFHELVRRLATLVGATEAAGFLLAAPAPGDVPDLLPVIHIRPGDSGPEVRAKTLAAFQDIARACVDKHRDGVFEVEGERAKQPAQKCLVALLGPADATFGVMAFIVRCEPAEAKRRLGIVQGRREHGAT